jgi:hypothetical protein
MLGAWKRHSGTRKVGYVHPARAGARVPLPPLRGHDGDPRRTVVQGVRPAPSPAPARSGFAEIKYDAGPIYRLYEIGRQSISNFYALGSRYCVANPIWNSD